MLRIISAFLVLVAIWLLLSGIYKPMVIGFGVVSALVAIWVVARMNAQDEEPILLPLRPLGFVGYLFWLMIEIAKANWTVTKVIMAPVMPVRQHLFRVNHTQKSDVAQVIYANSITLTPGTITVETEPQHFLVHALAYTHSTMAELSDMDARVSRVEGET